MKLSLVKHFYITHILLSAAIAMMMMMTMNKKQSARLVTHLLTPFVHYFTIKAASSVTHTHTLQIFGGIHSTKNKNQMLSSSQTHTCIVLLVIIGFKSSHPNSDFLTSTNFPLSLSLSFSSAKHIFRRS